MFQIVHVVDTVTRSKLWKICFVEKFSKKCMVYNVRQQLKKRIYVYILRGMNIRLKVFCYHIKKKVIKCLTS